MKIVKIFSVIGSVCVLSFLILYTIYQILFSQPLVYPLQPFTLDKSVYHHGDNMIVTSYRCNNEGIPIPVATISRDFFNLKTGEVIPRATGVGIVQPGCGWAEAIAYDPFPETMPTGTYIIRGITKADGRYRTINVPWQSQSFMYVADTPGH